MLPMSLKEARQKGIKEFDFIIVTGDAYIDHHSFGTAIIGRLLERNGYRVGIIARPDWKNEDDFKQLGRPRLAFLVNSGVVDSMVNNYSVFKRRRRVDEYAPNGEAGGRPDRAVIVYCNLLRKIFGDIPILIGGIEASLRRFGHYDYWSDKLRRSILLDSGADILMYGMGERTIVELAEALDSGIPVKEITWVKGTCIKSNSLIDGTNPIVMPDFKEIKQDKKAYCKSFVYQYENNDSINGRHLAEKYENGIWVIQNPPQPPLETDELDHVYELPFENRPHPSYGNAKIPAFSEVKFSLVGNRGCFGGCSFCAITFHQGRAVRGRSEESLLREARKLTEHPDFKGYIHDIGGPTANFMEPSCSHQLQYGICKKRQCLHPSPCPRLKVSHTKYINILKKVRQIPKVKKVFVRSGIRYDYLMLDKDQSFLRELCENHISGLLKVAPEHLCDHVLYLMGKPSIEVFDRFVAAFKNENARLGKKQYLIPYLISSHPGSRLEDALDMAIYLKKSGFVPDQVQDFYPTPSTLSTCMYYTEMNPLTGEDVYVAKDLEEKKLQRALLHFNKTENKQAVMKALEILGREEMTDFLLGGKGSKDRSRSSARDMRRQHGNNKGKVRGSEKIIIK